MKSNVLTKDGNLVPNFRIEVDQWIHLGGYHSNDEENLVNYLNDLTIYKNTLNIPHPYGYDDALWWLTNIAEKESKIGFQPNWTIRHSADGLIGGIGLVVEDVGLKPVEEIGYWLGYPYRRQGIMSDVIRAFTSFCFLHFHTIQALCAHVYTFNKASQKTLLKAGFNESEIIKDYYLKNDKKLDAIRFIYKRTD